MSLIRKHGAVLQAWACLDLVCITDVHSYYDWSWTTYSQESQIRQVKVCRPHTSVC